MSAYLLRRGPGARRRVAHLAHYNGHGQIDRARCGETRWNLSSNVPWGQRTCKRCLRTIAREDG